MKGHVCFRISLSYWNLCVCLLRQIFITAKIFRYIIKWVPRNFGELYLRLKVFSLLPTTEIKKYLLYTKFVITLVDLKELKSDKYIRKKLHYRCVRGSYPSTVFAKSFIIDVWQDPRYASVQRKISHWYETWTRGLEIYGDSKRDDNTFIVVKYDVTFDFLKCFQRFSSWKIYWKFLIFLFSCHLFYKNGKKNPGIISASQRFVAMCFCFCSENGISTEKYWCKQEKK